MNILVLSHRIPFPANKGEKIRTFNQVKYLADAGHNLHVLAPIEGNAEVEFMEGLNKFSNITCNTFRLHHKALRLLQGLIYGEPLSVANFYTKKLQDAFHDELVAANSADALDAIICTSSAMAKYVYQSEPFKQLNKKPLLLMDFMDLDSDKWQQYADNSSFPMTMVYQREANLLTTYEQDIQQYFDGCFFIADAEVNLFKKQVSNASNVFTLGNGMCTDEFYPAKETPNNENPVFLFTGVMDYKPNIDAVVWFVETVWPSIIAEYKKARFIIAGMNPVSAVSELTNATGIEVTGFVDDILPYYHQADYFVAPFRLARGVQNKVLQAFACGLPVISTSMGAEGIECVQGEHILIANNDVEFFNAVEKLESDNELLTAIKNNALSLIHQQYSWHGKLQVLDDVLHGKL